MLERTAAGLESGNFTIHRVLPRSTRPPRRPKKPQPVFVQRNGCRTAPSVGSQPFRPDAFAGPFSARNESSPLLDFLYPWQTHALLRQQPRPLLRPRNITESSNFPRGCRYASSSAPAQTEEASQTVQATPTDEQPSVPTPKKRTRWDSAPAPTKETYNVLEHDDPSVTVGAAEQNAEQDALRGSSTNRTTLQATLPDLLADDEGQLFHDVWDLYCRLDAEGKPTTRSRVVQYLSRSRSVVEAGRAMSLFRQVPVEQWDDDFLSASVLVMLRSGDQARAIETFKKGLRTKGLVGGLEYLVIDSANKQQWVVMLDAWLAYCKYIAQEHPGENPDEGLLEPLTSLESLGALYFSFERYLAADDMRVERWLDLDKTSKTGLRILRRKFAIEALRQPCPPNQASVILAFWGDHWMYERYLWRMFDRWYTKRISSATARMLPAIYQDFKSLPGAKPSTDVMRGIFKVHQPHGVAALEDLYKDWVRCWGELSQWAFEKFLKFYAHQGDVKRVKELWNRFVKLFPWKLETPRGFRSTMNVYAQTADVAGAEHELDRMVNHYKVEPDLDIWNTLLKCYVRAGDYSKALSCFQDISKAFQPDAFTYTHVMAMCSKKGDLDRTVDFFNEAQKKGVPISKEMGLSLVSVYCRNDQLLEAENICMELAQRRITSTAMFNQLLQYNGMHGHLTRCYALLEKMKKFNLEWDQVTIGNLLLAMVRVNQISAAYQIIRDAARHKMHVLQPDHFATVMLGAMRLGDRNTAEGLVSLMEKASIPMSFNAMVAYTQTALKEAPNTMRTPTLGKELVASLRSLVKQSSGDVRRLKHETSSMGRAVQLLVQFRDFARAEELVNLFIELFPQYGEGEDFPQDVVASLMLAYHRDENYDQVMELWHEVWPKILKRCSVVQGDGEQKGIYPAHQYDVTRIVFRVVATYRAMNDGKGLLECVEQVVAAGFKLTSSTWDRIIRGLAELGQWERGMYWCETMLMPAWRGWNPKKLRLEERRATTNPQVLQPTPQAILALQKEWLETRRLAVWSADVARKLADMERRYPILHYAFITSHYTDSPGPWIFRGDVDLDKAMSEMLAPLSRSELRKMKKELEAQLEAQIKAMREGGEDRSPFRRFGPSKDSTRALEENELNVLRSTLRQKLTKPSAKTEAKKDEQKKKGQEQNAGKKQTGAKDKSKEVSVRTAF